MTHKKGQGIKIFTSKSDECEVYPPERSEGGIHTSYIATMSIEVHTTLCVQIGRKSRIACERVVSREQSSVWR